MKGKLKEAWWVNKPVFHIVLAPKQLSLSLGPGIEDKTIGVKVKGLSFF